MGEFESRASSSSTRFDVDWLRVVSGHGLPPPGSPLGGNAYMVGNFDGMFEGAFFVSHIVSIPTSKHANFLENVHVLC